MSVYPTAIEQHIEDHKKDYIDRLAKAVAIKSDVDHNEKQSMADFLLTQLQTLNGIEATQQKIGDKYPPLVIGTLGNEPSYQNVLIYGHYDVQPVSWQSFLNFAKPSSSPVRLTRKTGMIRILGPLRSNRTAS